MNSNVKSMVERHHWSKPSPHNKIPFTTTTDLTNRSMEEAALVLLRNLVDNPIDRNYLLSEAFIRSPSKSTYFNIDHPILYGLLKINSSYKDEDLLQVIRDLIWKVGEYARRREDLRRRAMENYRRN